MPWYQPCDPRGYTKFFDGPDSSTGYVDPDRTAQWEVTDEYLHALEAAYRQGFFDAGGQNVEDTGALVFDKLAANCVQTTEDAYRVGRADAPIANALDPGGTVDISGIGSVPGTAIPSTPAMQDAGMIYAAGATPSGQPSQPVGVSVPYVAPIGSGPSSSSYGTGGGGLTTLLSPRTATGGINWLLIAAVAAGAWFLLRKRS